MAALSQLYNACEQGFAGLKSSLESHEHEDDKLESRVLDQYERFQIWAGNIGARQHAQVKTSLDWRLREAPRLKHQIEELLEDLASAAEELTSITSGERPNRTSTPVSGDDGLSSEQPGVSETDELVETLSETIAGLFKITLLIQRATPRDRFVKAQASVKEPFDSTWDILHVSHKFPRLASVDLQWLQRKFGLANAQRRQFFRYARQHKEKKAAAIRPASFDIQYHKELDLRIPVETEANPLETKSILSSQKPASSFAQTTASTLVVNRLPVAEQESDEDAMSRTSFATSVNESGAAHQLRVPQLQDISQGQIEFECPYCYSIVRPKSQNQWKKHVFEDLRPYICTFKGCDTKLFSDRRTWFEHELRNHRVAYQCHFCPHSVYRSEEELQKHLVTRHEGMCPPSTISAITQASQEPQESFDASSCVCCVDWTSELRKLNSHISTEDSILVTEKQFRNHLANHQEQLALFALPKHYSNGEDDIESAGVAAGDNSANLSDVSLLSMPYSRDEDIKRVEKLFSKLTPLLSTAESSDNYTLNTVVNQLLLEPEQVDKVFRLLLQSSHPLREDLVKLALDNGADPNQLVYVETPLFVAVRHMSLDLVRMLLNAGASAIGRNEGGETALYLTARTGWIDGCQLIVERGGNLHKSTDNYGNRPIHIAAQNLQTDFLKYLLHAGASINSVNMIGQTALHVATLTGDVTNVRLLLTNSIDLDVSDSAQRTALHYAVFNVYVEAVQTLLSHGANPNTMDASLVCPLLTAVQNPSVDSIECQSMVRSLLDSGASIQLWRSRVDIQVLRSQILLLQRLQNVLGVLEGPVTAEIQDYIDEAKLSKTIANTTTVQKNGKQEDPKAYARMDLLPSAGSNYWLETEASQLEYLRLKKARNEYEHGLPEALHNLGSLYQDWMSAIDRSMDVLTISEASVMRNRLSCQLAVVSIDLWSYDRCETAKALMAAAIRSFNRPNEDPDVNVEYNIVTAIAAAMRMKHFQDTPWRNPLAESDWESILRQRTPITRIPFGPEIIKCSKCPGIDYWNETIYRFHLLWHEIEQEQANNTLIRQGQTTGALEANTAHPLYSGAMLYGVARSEFIAERSDEMSIVPNESLMLLARSNHDWLVARSVLRWNRPGLVPISFLDIHIMSSGYIAEDAQSALAAACLPSVKEWKHLDTMLQLRSSMRLSTVPFESPVSASVIQVEISNNHDMYHVDCKSDTGDAWTILRYYMEFVELQNRLIHEFPKDAQADEHDQRILPYLHGPSLHEGRTESLNVYMNHLLLLPSAISQCELIKRFFTPGMGDGAEVLVKESPFGGSELSSEAASGLFNAGEQNVEAEPLPKWEWNNVHRPMARHAFHDVLVTGFPRYNIKLKASNGRQFADWLIHIFALDLGSDMGYATRALLDRLGVVCSNYQDFHAWVTSTIYEQLGLHQVESISTHFCANCGREPAKLWTNQAQYNLNLGRSTVRLCVACIVSLNFLDVKHSSDHQQFGEWLVPKVLDLGSTIIRPFPVTKTGAAPRTTEHQRAIVTYGLDILDAIASVWQSTTAEEQVSNWVWAMILTEPNSYMMTQRETDLLERYQPQKLSRHERSILRAAFTRYQDSRSSEVGMSPLTTSLSPEMADNTPISFLFTVIDIQTDYSAGSRPTWKKQWLPPDTCDGIKPSISEQRPSQVYRWLDGAVQLIDDCNPDDYNLTTSLSDIHTFSTYTVLMDESKAFACVPFDARRVEVRSSGIGEWQYLGFNHIYDNSGKDVLSKVVAPGEFPRLAGYKEDDSAWIRDLFPGEYRSAVRLAKDKQPVTHHGLVGSLALILALATFTAPFYSEDVLTKCFQSGRKWQSRREVLHARMHRRGVIVTIWVDVSNPNACTRDALRRLEAGLLGPILHCENVATQEPSQDVAQQSGTPSSRQHKSKVDIDTIIGDDSTERFSRSGISKERTEIKVITPLPIEALLGSAATSSIPTNQRTSQEPNPAPLLERFPSSSRPSKSRTKPTAKPKAKAEEEEQKRGLFSMFSRAIGVSSSSSSSSVRNISRLSAGEEESTERSRGDDSGGANDAGDSGTGRDNAASKSS